MADLVVARESYWVGERMVPAGTVMAASDPRVRGPHVVEFVAPEAPPVEPPIESTPPAPRTRKG